MSGSEASDRQRYAVEIRAGMGQENGGDVGPWMQLLDRVSALEQSREVLRAMPSVAEGSSPEGDPEVVLRWVEIHAEDAARALQQVIEAFVQLAVAMQLSPQRVRCEAHQER